MSAFTGEITVTHMDQNWRLWRLESRFSYEVGAEGSGRSIVVPIGFVTDGASVPRAFWAILPAWGSYSRAALVHDFLCYRLHERRPHLEALTREAADQVFLEAMKVCGTAWMLRRALYAGARIGAWMSRRGIGAGNVVSQVNPLGL